MEDMSGKVQNANTHILQCQNHEHAHSSRSVQGPVQWGDGTLHAWVRFGAKLTQSCHSTTPTVKIPVGDGLQFKEGSKCNFLHTAHTQGNTQSIQRGDGTLHRVRFAGKLTHCQTTHIAMVSISVGRWNVTHGFDSQESSQPATERT